MDYFVKELVTIYGHRIGCVPKPKKKKRNNRSILMRRISLSMIRFDVGTILSRFKAIYVLLTHTLCPVHTLLINHSRKTIARYITCNKCSIHKGWVSAAPSISPEPVLGFKPCDEGILIYEFLKWKIMGSVWNVTFQYSSILHIST